MNQDFTVEQYRELLSIAKRSYQFISYDKISFEQRFILWRHDVDYSMNRSLRLAELEYEEGIRSTFFVNPHCEFYNLLEKGQNKILRRIIELGHSVGLHFDAEYYGVKSETELDSLIELESKYLQEWIGTQIKVFSFHNPTPFLLSCEKETYGGLINCYSNFFKSSISYCSDSNGYWRFRRIKDVLEAASDSFLQVLTHPGWWQEKPMTPRERIFRCVDSRASFVMRSYDDALMTHGRSNLGELTVEFSFLKQKIGKKADLIDYQWMRGEFIGVYIDIWRIFESQLVKSCRIWFRKILGSSLEEVNSIFQSSLLTLPMHRVFLTIYQSTWSYITKSSEEDFLTWQKLRDDLVHGLHYCPKEKLEEGIIYIVSVMRHLSEFIESSPTSLPRLQNNHEIGLTEIESGEHLFLKWLIDNSVEIGIDDEMLKEFLNNKSKVRLSN